MLLLLLVPILVLILLANFLVVQDNDRLNRWFDYGLLAFNLPVMLLGIAFASLPPQARAQMQNQGFPISNWEVTGYLFAAMGIWGAIMSIREVRRWLARWLPLQPASPVHALALALSGYLMGNTLITLAQGGLTELAETAVSASIWDVLLQQTLFLLVAILGVGAFIRRSGPTLRRRLGLERPTRDQLIFGLRWMIILLLVQWGLGALSAWMDPQQSELMENISTQLYGDFDTVWEWLVLALAAGVGEEILFRGAMQPALGLSFTALVFAIAHVQYGFTPVTMAVFIIGVALGYVRERSNTTVAIFVHAGYNFILGLLALLANYLEPFVGG